MEEHELELSVGDLLERKRIIADAIDTGEPQNYGPLTIQVRDGEVHAEDIDGYGFRPVEVPSGDMEDKVEELLGELDDAVEEMYELL